MITGKELKHRRIDVLKLSANQFARLVGASTGSTVRTWERLKRIPRWLEQFVIVLALLSAADRDRIVQHLISRKD